MRAGVSVSYYVRIEQGAATASPAVLEAIANTLDLSVEDRRHLFRLSQSVPIRGEAAGSARRTPGVPAAPGSGRGTSTGRN